MEPDHIHFDTDIIVNINSAMMTLTQIGIGPVNGFSVIDSSQVWDDLLLNSKNFMAVQMYIYIKTRLVFDPPTSAFVIDALERQATELEWRLRVSAETGTTE